MYRGGIDDKAAGNLLAGDLLHYVGSIDPRSGKPIDPEYRALKERLIKSRTPEQIAVDKRAFESEKKFYKENPPSFEDWMDFNRGDAYVRGYLTPDARDEWRDVYTPEQKQILEQMRQHLSRQTGEPR
jgi:hypothetical protein